MCVVLRRRGAGLVRVALAMTILAVDAGAGGTLCGACIERSFDGPGSTSGVRTGSRSDRPAAVVLVATVSPTCSTTAETTEAQTGTDCGPRVRPQRGERGAAPGLARSLGTYSLAEASARLAASRSSVRSRTAWSVSMKVIPCIPTARAPATHSGVSSKSTQLIAGTPKRSQAIR
jgi:hypothetical protein